MFMRTFPQQSSEADATSPQGDGQPGAPLGADGQPVPSHDGFLVSIGKGALHIISHPGETLRSVGRGAGDLVQDLSKTLMAATPIAPIFTKASGKTEQQSEAEQTARIGRANDWLFGPRSTAASEQFVEDTSQFLLGFAGAGELKVAGKALKTLGPIAGGLARGAIVDFAAVDPYKANLAELAASTSVPGVSDLGKLLSVTEDDGPIVARLKRSLGGLIPGAAIDGLVASARLLRGTSVLKDASASPAAKAAAQEAISRESATLTAIKDGTHVADDPIVVRPTADGRYALEVNPEASREVASTLRGSRTVYPLPDKGHTPGAPTFDSRFDAEGQAASVNEALAKRFEAHSAVSSEETQGIFDLAKQVQVHSGDPDRIVAMMTGEPRFNFTYLDAPAKTESLLRAIGEKLTPVFDKAQGRPGVPLSASVDRAIELAGMIPKDAAEEYLKSVGSILKNTDANVLVMNSRLVILGKQVAKWSTILDDRPMDTVALGEARTALRGYVDAAAEVAGTNSGVGRGLNALKARGDARLKGLTFGGTAAAGTKGATEGLAPDLIAGMTAADLRDVTRLFRMSDEPKVLFDTLGGELPHTGGKLANIGRGIQEFFYSSILSNPATHAGIFLANTTVSMLEDGVRLLAGVGSHDAVLIREATDLLMGRAIYFKQSVKGMVAALKAGHSIIDPRPVYKAIPGIGGDIVRSLSSRPMAAMDEFWKVNNNLAFVRMNSLKLARQDAAAQGLTGEALDHFLASRVDADVRASLDASGASRLPDARQFAAFPTFNSPLQAVDFGASLEQLVQNHPILTPVLPFVRTSVNVMDYTFRRGSPLGVFSQNIRESLKAGGPEAAITATRMAVGTTIWGGAGLMAFGGGITGHGPSDPQLRKLWLASHQPYSIKVGNEWISYRRVEPFATPLAVAADLAAILRDNSDDLAVQQDGSKVFYGLVAAAVSGMTNKTYLSGLVNFMDAVGSGSPNKVKSFIDNLMATAIPGVVQVANNDPYLRDTQGMFDALVNRVPGWSKTLPARYNAFGEPIRLDPSRLERTVNPLPAKDATPQVEDDLLQLNRALMVPPTVERFGSISINLHNRAYLNRTNPSSKLTPYEAMMESVRSQGLRKKVEDLVNSTAYQRAGDGTQMFEGGRRYEEVQHVVGRVYEKARRKMLSDYPMLAHELKALDRGRRMSARGNDAGAMSILEQIPRTGVQR